ncbi:MAG: LLM class flavin-dependent oxidoreductase [Dehalococcoidia bacterium]|nr:LLM class flavin-dependent oxidoreductase [Dehalococcoidia bacterium]
MKLGLLLTNQYLAGESMERKIQDNLEQVRAAREGGFGMICAGQHYLSAPFTMPTSIPFLARMAAEADDMEVASSIVLVPLHNPVEMAEMVATMDAICSGRFIFGIGLGYREEEYAAFGVRREERVPRMAEALEVMKLLWTGEEVEFHGRFYQVPRVTSTVRCVQQPHPPIWVAANNDGAIRRAGRLGYPWLVNPHATVATIRAQMDMYRGVLEESGVAGLPALPMMREMYVAEDREVAMYESRPHLEGKYQAYADWGQDKALPGEESFEMPFEDLARDRFLIGTPDDIVSEIRRYEEELGVTHMIFRLQWPGLEQDKVMKQLELMARYVIPRLAGEGGA